jgi:uncharacterized NAD-dependent epimerase/dehydratase family protein
VDPIKIDAPYLILVGGEVIPAFAKTGMGIIQWAPEYVAGQLRFSDEACDGVRSVIIGVAPIGGTVPDSWWEAIHEAVRHGLDIVCGLHVRLADQPSLVAAAKQSGSRLIDVRVPPANIPIGSGLPRRGKRILTVGLDCSIGKKYTALALHRALRERGIDSTFRATGQTGIVIAGNGIPIDAVVADFISGAAEIVSPDNDVDHWDVIEGQGSLFHPAYSGVSLGLLHGSQPDAFVVCHDATRTNIFGWEQFALPSIQDCIDLHVRLGRLTNPAIQCAGISVNTSELPERRYRDYLARLSRDHSGLPCVDPIRDGCAAIAEHIEKHFEACEDDA